MQGNRTRIAICTMLLCLALILLSACAKKTPTPEQVIPTAPPQSTQAPVKRERTVVRFATSDIEAPQYEGLIEAFEEENPDLRVEIVSINEVLELGALANPPVPEDATRRLAEAADVFAAGGREPVQQGLLKDLTPLMEADRAFDADDYMPGSIESLQWDGGTWGLPRHANPRVLFYDKDAFDAAGLDYPQPGWRWDEMASLASTLTQRQGDEASMWGFVCSSELAYRMIESQSGGLVDLSVEPPMPQLDSDAAADALEWFVNLYDQAQAMPFQSREQRGDAPMSQADLLIDKGQAAMWLDYAILYPFRNLQGNVGVVPLPEGDANVNTTPIWVSPIAISAGSAQPEAAWRWAKYLSSHGLEPLGQVLPPLPVHRDMLDAYWADLDDDVVEALQYVWEHGYIAAGPFAWQEMTTAIEAAIEGQPAAEALEIAQTAARQERQAAISGETEVTPVPTFVVEASESESEAAIEITFVPGLGSFNMEPYRRLADAFGEAHPEIRVKIQSLNLSGGSVPDIAAMAKTADCFQWYPSLQTPANRDAILSLDPFIETDPELSAEAFYPQMIQSYYLQERLWGLPADATPFVIEYNRDLFDAAGVDYPAANWTWDDFVATSVALTHGEGDSKQYGYVAEIYESSDLLLMLERLGAHYLDTDGDLPRLSLDDPTVIEALEWYAKLSTDHQVKPTYITDVTALAGSGTAYMEREGLINSGRAAMWTNAGTMTALFGPRQGLNLGVATVPSRADGSARTSLLTTSGYFISAETPHRQACWKWITFLTQQPEAVSGFPARISVSESDAYLQVAGEERVAAYMAAVLDGANPSALQTISEQDWMGAGLFWLYQAYGKVVQGDLTAEQALVAAQELADSYMDCVAAAGDHTRDTWLPCLQETDPTLPAFLFAQ